MGKWAAVSVLTFAGFLLPYQDMGCLAFSGLQQAGNEEKPEVISLLGKLLYASPAEGEDLAKLESELEVAERDLKADPGNPELVVWRGRRLAYLWRYHEAIEAYSSGIEKFPEHAMLYRHRGHRYISIRAFDKAVDDLMTAARLNDSDFDIWYHLALAQFLTGDFASAERSYRECMKTVTDDDSLIAVSNWLYMTFRRQGKDQEAESVLRAIREDMEVVENGSYFNLLLFYQGKKSSSDMKLLAEESELDRATISYGVGCWHLYNGDSTKAMEYFDLATSGKYWPAFGYIAAEAELARDVK